MNPCEYCPDCRKVIGEDHTEVTCLRTQVAALKTDVATWKTAWFDQRDATGRVAWWWQADWMRGILAAHLGVPSPAVRRFRAASFKRLCLPPMKDRHGCLGCPMVPTANWPAGECPYCGNMNGPP